MDINTMTFEDIETRLSQIREEMDQPDADLAALTEEVNQIEARKKVLTEQAAARNQLAARIAAGTEPARVVRTFKGGGTDNGASDALLEVRGSHPYNIAYAEYLKTGDDKECRALLTDLVEGGEVPVPTYLENGIQTAWKAANIASRARQIAVKGIIEIPFEYAATAAVVHTEGAAAPAEEELELGAVTIKPETLKKWITVSDTVMALKGEAFLDYIIAEIAQRIAELEDKEAVEAIKAAVGGTTKTQPGVKQIVEAEITAFTIFNALAELADGAGNPVAVMNRKTYFGKVMHLKDTTGRPIYNVVPENGAPTYYINGVPVLFNDNLAADTEMLVGDFDGLLENVPDGGINFIRDPYSLAEKNLIKIVGRKMVGFGVTKENYFVLVQIGA